MRHTAVTTLSQEEDIQEIENKISSKRVKYEEARTQMAELKTSYEKAEQEYQQHKEQISTVAEEADSKKVKTADRLQAKILCHLFLLFIIFYFVLTNHTSKWIQSKKYHILEEASFKQYDCLLCIMCTEPWVSHGLLLSHNKLRL